MKHHLKYRYLLLLAVVSAALVFTACGADMASDSAVDAGSTEMISEDSAMPDTTTSENEDEMAEEDTTMSDNEDETKTQEDTTDEDSMAGDKSTMENSDSQKVFTLEELAQYDGKDGNKAYVAVDGVVYDVSDKPLWAGGEHQNRVSAGMDLSDAILQSPHGKAKLEDLPIVGTLAEE
jgi:predicted heme/steroid binding protein